MLLSKPPAFAPKVTPDPEQARALERRLASLAYQPTNGFHRDTRQPKKERQ
jgi:hypothetical protein